MLIASYPCYTQTLTTKTRSPPRQALVQTLATYIQLFGRLGEAAFLGEVGCPVIVQSAHGDARVETGKAFRTEHVTARDVVPRMLTSDQREVLLVQKSQASAFAGHISVGRTPNLDVSIPRTGVSKFHAYFSVAPGGGFQLTDKDSTNGTYLNGERLLPGISTQVPNGAEVRFATHVFTFMLPRDFLALIRSIVE
jgi:FHA domain